MDDISKYQNFELSNGITIRQYQLKVFEIFKYFKKICEDNNLTYWCGGGTMLGAVRHGGFIPWDDDIDVFMPRKDYNRLYEIWNKVADTTHYALARTDKSHNYHHTDMWIVDLQTTYIYKYSENEDIFHGCYIDVIPFEGCPSSFFKRIKQIYHSILYGIYNVQRLPDNQSRFLRLPTKIALSLVRNPEKRYQIWKNHENKMSKYDFYKSKFVKETITSFKGLFRKYNRELFQTIDMPFEGIMVKIPMGYDKYLTRIYGDYMQAPSNPLNSMKKRYDVIKYINLKEPFTKYRGIHYLEKE